ncbi:hypothetical protein PIIN_06830 [Serendipita indica DSM 11827]|uniref:DUF6533 domain-containing protein n=1 Tax=Serendipita indica (strain DSM 11827) TaxID=1109443 RepID=G4TNJ3_SERID|nr:hypothetical protein PIIN_06830 [Serendipita indica DSM 11827]
MPLAEVIFQALDISRYFAFAAVTIAIYDWILLLKEEVKLLGGARMSLGKILFYLTRVTTIPGLIHGVYTLSPLRPRLNQNCLLSIFLSYWLLTLRVVALYQRNRIAKIILYFSLISCYLIAFGALLSCLHELSKNATYVPLVDVCMPAGLNSRISIVFEAPLVFEIIMFAALIYRAVTDLKFQGSLTMLPLFRVLYRDGILFFVIMTSTRIWNIYKYSERPVYEALEGLYIMWSIVCVLSCRVYINIVYAARTPQQHGSRSRWDSMQDNGYSLWELTPRKRSDSTYI